MPVHLLAYNVTTVANVLTNMNGLVDQVITRAQTSNAYLLPAKMQLLAAVGMGATITRLQLLSPTLRQVNTPNIRPLIPDLQPLSNSRVMWYRDRPLMLPALEEIQPVVLDTAIEVATALFWVADSILPIPSGPIMKIRGTSTTAAVANTWTLLTYTLDVALPAGMYALVGSECISTTGIAHRWQIPGQLLRPGSMSHQAITDIQDPNLAEWKIGAYGNFVQTALPQPEVLCTAADAAHEIYMDIVPLNFSLSV